MQSSSTATRLGGGGSTPLQLCPFELQHHLRLEILSRKRVLFSQWERRRHVELEEQRQPHLLRCVQCAGSHEATLLPFQGYSSHCTQGSGSLGVADFCREGPRMRNIVCHSSSTFRSPGDRTKKKVVDLINIYHPLQQLLLHPWCADLLRLFCCTNYYTFIMVAQSANECQRFAKYPRISMEWLPMWVGLSSCALTPLPLWLLEFPPLFSFFLLFFFFLQGSPFFCAKFGSFKLSSLRLLHFGCSAWPHPSLIPPSPFPLCRRRPWRAVLGNSLLLRLYQMLTFLRNHTRVHLQ